MIGTEGTSSQSESISDFPARESRRYFWAVIVGIVLYVVLDVIAQLLPPHYSPISQAESDLAVGPYGYVMTVNFVNRGILSLVFLYGLLRIRGAERGSWADSRAGFALLGIWGVGALLLAAFPTDVPSTPVSWHGAIHLVVAVLAFIGGGAGAYVVSTHFKESDTLREAASFAIPLGGIALLLLAVELLAGFIVPRLAADVGGLTERLFLGSVLLWMFLVSVYLVTRPLPGRSPR